MNLIRIAINLTVFTIINVQCLIICNASSQITININNSLCSSVKGFFDLVVCKYGPSDIGTRFIIVFS